MIFPYLLIVSGFKLFFNLKINRLILNWAWGISHILFFAIALGNFFTSEPLYSGIVGYEINFFFD